MALTKITKTGIGADAIDGNKLGDNSISDEHLDVTSITGQTELSESAAGSDVLLIYDASAGTLKKIQASNVGLQAPTLSSISPTSVLTGDGTGNFTFTFTGTGFTATAVPTLITEGGSDVAFDSFTIDSNTQITAVIAKSSLSDANEPYDARITVAGALTATLLNQVNVDESPVFNTSAGSLGSFPEQTTISTIDIEAYDPDSTGNVTFDLQSGSLPPGLSATTVNENGVSKYRITGTLSTDRSSFTTTNFTLRASDANSNTTSRAFSISEVPAGVESFTSSGTFSVPTGITSVDVLVVAAGGGGGSAPAPGGTGGGGAGGLIFVPGFPVTPGGTVPVTVGCGGPGTGQDSIFSTLTAKGGGIGGTSPAATPGGPGGSGGGGRGGYSGQAGYAGGTATQPTQPGQSGAYGFGNNGGEGGGGPPGDNRGEGGGGGGAGASGGNSYQNCGGTGKAYTIADGTTPVYYAGGGGGGASSTYPSNNGPGGQGGGGNGGTHPGGAAQPGQANKGGGAGGPNSGTATGGKGIVIVKY